MERRYALRFENGERRGETLPIAGAVVTVGRRPGNAIQIIDASVSGKHAEFVVEEGGVLVRDLGSTNGTRIGTERISERRLAHGDQVLLGNMRLLFIDAEVGQAPPLSASPDVDTPQPAAGPGAAGEGVHTISAESIARTKVGGGVRSTATWALILVALGGGGGGAFWWLRSRGAQAGREPARQVAPVAGNLLAEGFSFEDDGAGWSPVEQGPSAFGADPSANRSGEVGLSAEVAGDEWAEHRSPPARPPRGRALEVRAWVRAEDADGRVGVLFEDTTGAARPFTVWSPPAEANAGFDPLAMVVGVPPGYDRARAALRAEPLDGNAVAGAVEVDDVSLVPVDGGGAAATLGEFELFLLGEPPTVGVLFKIDRVLISGLRAARGGGADRVRLASQEGESGIRIDPGDGATELALRVEPALAAGGIASAGEGGHLAHATEFEREGSTALLLGTGRDLVRLGFDGPVRISGRPEAGGFLIQVSSPAEPLGTGCGFDLQLSFRAERNAAQGIARDAREAEEEGRPGAAIALWDRVLDEAPFEEALVREAEGARSRLVDAGLLELRELSQRVERARFFHLVEVFRRCRAGANAVAARYAASEVEDSARELTAEIDGDLSVLEADLDRYEKARLEAILRTLERGDAGESPLLAGRVRAYLQERFGGGGS